MVSASAPAKINLVLTAGPRREDGYHDLLTLFQAVSLRDVVTVREAREPGIRITLTGEHTAGVPTDESNLAARAAAAVARILGVSPAVELQVEKNIPVAAGLAGGSADAAATLVAVNELWSGGLEDLELHHVARHLGSDVNFALGGWTGIGRGRGDRVTPLESAPLTWVLAYTAPGLSTPRVFAELDQMRPEAAPVPADLPEGLTRALRAGDLATIGAGLANDLQAPALKLAPHLEPMIEAARTAGAEGAVISGSGPTVAALVADHPRALAVAWAMEAAAAGVHAVIVDAPEAGARLGT